MLCWFFSGYLVTTGQDFLGILEMRVWNVETRNSAVSEFLFLDCDRKSVIQNFDVMLENVRGFLVGMCFSDFGCVNWVFWMGVECACVSMLYMHRLWWFWRFIQVVLVWRTDLSWSWLGVYGFVFGFVSGEWTRKKWRWWWRLNGAFTLLIVISVRFLLVWSLWVGLL